VIEAGFPHHLGIGIQDGREIAPPLQTRTTFIAGPCRGGAIPKDIDAATEAVKFASAGARVPNVIATSPLWQWRVNS